MARRANVVALLVVAGILASLTASMPAGAATPKLGKGDWPTICNSTSRTIGTPYKAGLNCRRGTIGGIERRYVVWVPTAVAATTAKVPAVFMFHGSSGTGEQYWQISGWREVADREGLIAVFPTGANYRILETGNLSTKWHAYSLACDVDTSVTPLRDDIAFTDRVLNDVIASEQIDQNRVYASGFSNGSSFAQRLAVDRGNRFAAVASWAGALSECLTASPPEPLPNPSANPAPAWFGVGSEDPLYLGNQGVTDLPMDPNTLNVAMSGLIVRTARSQGLDRAVWVTRNFASWNGWTPQATTWPTAEWTVMQWPLLGTGTEPTDFFFSVLRGVAHHYPNAKVGAGASNASSSYVNIAEVFWLWFEKHARD